MVLACQKKVAKAAFFDIDILEPVMKMLKEETEQRQAIEMCTVSHSYPCAPPECSIMNGSSLPGKGQLPDVTESRSSLYRYWAC